MKDKIIDIMYYIIGIIVIGILLLVLLSSCATTSPDFPGYSKHIKSRIINYKPIKKYKK